MVQRLLGRGVRDRKRSGELREEETLSVTLLCSEQWSGFPSGSAVKNLPANAGDMGLIPGLGGSAGGGHGTPLQYSCPENPHGQRSLAGYSPWGRKELDTIEYNKKTKKDSSKCLLGFPGGLGSNESVWNAGAACQCRGPRFDPWLGRPLEKEWQPTPIFLPGESHA